MNREREHVRTIADLIDAVGSTGLDIEEKFKDLHHFSRHPPFSTQPRAFSHFTKYCVERPSGIRPGQQNEATIQRTYVYVQLRASMSHQAAVERAWEAVPLAPV